MTSAGDAHSLHATIEIISTFNTTTLEILKSLADEQPVGNRWFKVNLHVHGEGNDPVEVVKQARQAEIDLLAVTDHQSFSYCDAIIAAAITPGRPLTILPGIEITSLEGVHLLGIFPPSFGGNEQTRLLGWLEIPGSGDTKIASTKKLSDILEKVREEGGIIVVPHPFSDGIGMLDSARKLNIKTEWLESGHVGLMQMPEDKIQHVEWDDAGNWINRYVLSTANSAQIKSSNYCLAPFNRSDAHKTGEISDGCSWFRMGEATVEGLKQVACEPKTRISRMPPAQPTNDAILAVRVNGGYSDGQCFRFNGALNCIVGQNYAGKSAVFDFIRYGLGLENSVEAKVRENLLNRLYGILGFGGNVEVFVRAGGSCYAAKRGFNPLVTGSSPNFIIQSCPDKPIIYRLDPQTDSLEPVTSFEFIIEVYEQGRISRLRADVGRQLEMLDEFAGVGDLKKRRAALVSELTLSAEALAPLYEEREQLRGAVAGLRQLEEELAAKEALMPGAEEQKWAKASAFVSQVETLENELDQALQNIPSERSNLEHTTDLECLFGQSVPDLAPGEVARADLLSQMRDHVKAGLDKIESAQTAITNAIEALSSDCKALHKSWGQAYAEHQRLLGETLRKAGVESPQELITSVNALRKQIGVIKTLKQPRLTTINTTIDQKEQARAKLLDDLGKGDATLSAKRASKAKELTDALDGKIKIEVKPAADCEAYLRTLTELCGEIAARDSQIKNKDSQLAQIVSKLAPLRLANALRNKGSLQLPGDTSVALTDLCGITANTQNFLCRLADNIRRLNRLETVAAPDVPQILVQRRGETAFADLRTGLSQGEQSAAILTLALHTRAMPLIIDQPEDELGYSYVVHLIVPKILKAKFSRQILIVTHNANIPVLGDADYVIKMENRPRKDSGRTCVIADAGSFESVAVTKALIELEGGQRAFDFRRFRYAMPGNSI